MRDVWEAVNQLIEEAKATKKLPPARAAAEAILMFPRLLATLELVVRRSGHRDDIADLRRQLWEEMRGFNSVLFSIQERHHNWQIGEQDKNELHKAFRRIRDAAQKLEAAVAERRNTE